MLKNLAYLSNDKDYTIFKTSNFVLRFKSPYSLEKYTKIKEWDNGYLVVMAKYKHNKDVEEEYIDLIPILKDLYMDIEKSLSSIRKVELNYE